MTITATWLKRVINIMAEKLPGQEPEVSKKMERKETSIVQGPGKEFYLVVKDPEDGVLMESVPLYAKSREGAKEEAKKYLAEHNMASSQ